MNAQKTAQETPITLIIISEPRQFEIYKSRYRYHRVSSPNWPLAQQQFKSWLRTQHGKNWEYKPPHALEYGGAFYFVVDVNRFPDETKPTMA